jgi:hypothetical protein
MTDERAADQAQYLVSWLSILKSDTKGGSPPRHRRRRKPHRFLSRGTTAIGRQDSVDSRCGEEKHSDPMADREA